MAHAEANSADHQPEPILVRLTNLTQTDASPFLILPCPSAPSLASFAPPPEAAAGAAAALPSDAQGVQQAAELLQSADISYLYAACRAHHLR